MKNYNAIKTISKHVKLMQYQYSFIITTVTLCISGRSSTDMSFENKVVFITGAGSGIGAATAILFAKEGANVVAVDISEEGLKNVGVKIKNMGKKLLMINADVSKDEEMRIAIEQTIEKFEKLDVLVNNAGIGLFGNILDGKLLETYDKMGPINLRAIIHLTMLAAPHLIASKGNIINVSSVASRCICHLNTIAYCVTKAAVEHFTRGAALELASSGVRVNSIHPGPVWTNIADHDDHALWNNFKEKTALKKISEPEEIGELIMYLASDKARSITGSAFFCDNGFLLCS